MNNKININLADQATLETLPGIGDVLASRIIEYRANVHPFEEMIELAAVPGISENLVESLSEHITLEGGISELDVIVSASAEVETSDEVVIELDESADAETNEESAGAEVAIELDGAEDYVTDEIEGAEIEKEIALALESDWEEASEQGAESDGELEIDLDGEAEDMVEEIAVSTPEADVVLEPDMTAPETTTVDVATSHTTSTYKPNYVSPPTPSTNSTSVMDGIDWKTALAGAAVATLATLLLSFLFFGQGVSRNRQNVEALQADLSSLQATQSSLIEQLNTTNANFNTLSTEANSLQGQIKALSEQDGSLLGQFETLQEDINNNQMSIEEVRGMTESITVEMGNVVENAGILQEFLNAVQGLGADDEAASDTPTVEETEDAPTEEKSE